MEREKVEQLEVRLRDMREDVPEAAATLDVLGRAGLEVTWARRTEHLTSQRRPWLVRFKLPAPIAQGFELAPELLAILSPFEELQARDVAAAEQALAGNLRADRGLVLCVSRDERAEGRVRATLPATRRYLFLTFAQAAGAGDPQRWLRDLLRASLSSARLFAPGRLGSEWDFTGREAQLQEIGRLLLREGQPAGVFGLRRVGKTSLLLHWREALRRPGPGAPPDAVMLYLNLHAVGFDESGPAGFMRLVIREAQQWLPWLVGDRAPGPEARWATAHTTSRSPSEARLSELGREAIDGLLEWCVAHDRRLIVAIDEYEGMLRDDGLREGPRLLTWMRGLYQQNPQHFCFVVAGLDRDWLRRPRVRGQQNPLLGLVVDQPLPGLSRADLGTMIRRIGRRAQLEFDHVAVERIFEESGGHPYLARLLCDLIDQRTPVTERAPARVGLAEVEAVMPRFERETRQTMEEFAQSARIVSGLSELELAELAHGGVVGNVDPVALEELESYGIVGEMRQGGCGYRIGALGRWLRNNYEPPKRAVGASR